MWLCISASILPLTEFSTGAGPILQMQVISSPGYTEVGITEAKCKHSRDMGWLSFPVSLFPNGCQIYSVLRLNCGAGSDKMNCKKQERKQGVLLFTTIRAPRTTLLTNRTQVSRAPGPVWMHRFKDGAGMRERSLRLHGDRGGSEKGRRTRKMATCGLPVGPPGAIASLGRSPTLPGLEREGSWREGPSFKTGWHVVGRSGQEVERARRMHKWGLPWWSSA